MLLPALGKARDQAKAVQCVNNLKQIGLAEASYQADYLVMVPTLSENHTQNYGRQYWYTALPYRSYLGIPGTTDYWLWPEKMVCPKAPYFAHLPDHTMDPTTSYGRIIRPSEDLGESRFKLRGFFPLGVKKPAVRILLAENLMWNVKKEYCAWERWVAIRIYEGRKVTGYMQRNGENGGYCMRFPHNNKSNTLFFDLHVSQINTSVPAEAWVTDDD